MAIGRPSYVSKDRVVDKDLLRAPERAEWVPWRRTAARVLERKSFDLAMGLIVAINVVILVLETDADASCPHEVSCAPFSIRIFNWVFIALYTMESIARMVVLRCDFFMNRWNLLDLGVLIVGYVEAILLIIARDVPGMHMVRFIRLGRLFRAFRLVKVFPNLYTMVRGLVGTFGAVNWGFFMIFFMLLLWALMAVQVIQPDNRKLYSADEQEEWCAMAFSSVFHSVVYFFQTLVAGDSWGACAIPLVLKFPGHFWLLSFSYITVQLGMTNLILAVIVDAASQVRHQDMQEKARQKRRQEEEARQRLLKIVQSIDEDNNGSISLEELLTSYDTNLNFQNMMTTLNIEKKDIERMFVLMDTDKSGSLSYHEFIESIIKAEEQDVRIQLMMMKLELAEVSWLLRTNLALISPEPSQQPSSQEVRTKKRTSRPSAPAITTQGPQANLPRITGDKSIHASGKPNESQNPDRHVMPSRRHLPAPLPPMKFLDDRATHLGPEDDLEERLHQLGALLSERLQALVKDAADEFSALVSRAACKVGNPAHHSTSSVSPCTFAMAGSSWRQSVEDFQSLDSLPRGTTNRANRSSMQDVGNKLAQKWIAQHLDHL
eukprot:CAMPEP_0172804312 /NCGR_PEP_ID=MMETSP1075-20121228/5085_1 /TAXON_ID=2916 /ORGANISM="Ceratium fusus, Strain PA161109" /LENGTH=603 /DNA_ID=CAMNT_0013642873 /DNA_START=279 /DNA_END=2090 /DNA_ORIENTATION=+